MLTISDLTLAEEALPAVVGRLRYRQAARTWETRTPDGGWSPVDTDRARFIMADQAIRAASIKRRDTKASYEVRERQDALIAAYSSYRRSLAALRTLAGHPCIRVEPHHDPGSPSAFLAAVPRADGAFAPRADLYAAYAATTPSPVSRQAFGRAASEAFGPPVKRRGIYGWRGVRVPTVEARP